MAQLCDICGVRPATVRARLTASDGGAEILDRCETDYRRLARRRTSSPLKLLFGHGSLFGSGEVEPPTDTPTLDKYSRDLTRPARASNKRDRTSREAA